MTAELTIQRRTTGSFGNVTGELQGIGLAANTTVGQLGALVTVSGAVAGALTAIAVSSAQAFGEFDTARANLGTLVENTDQYTDALGALQSELDNNISRTDLLREAYNVASAGFTDQQEVVDILRASYVAAAGNQGELGETTLAVTRLLNAYGLEASSATDISNQLALAVQRGQTTLGELSPQLSRIASTAASAGVGIEELLQSVATATAQGAQTTEAAVTGLQRVIGSIVNPAQSSTLVELFDRLGTSGEQLIADNGLAGALRIIQGELGTTAEAIGAAFEGQAAQRTATALLNNLDSLEEGLNLANGELTTAADAFNVASNTLASDIEALGNAFDTLRANIGEGVAQIARPIIGLATDIIDSLNQLQPETTAFIGRIIAIAAPVAGAVAAVAGAQLAFAALAPAIGLATAALAPLLPALIVGGTVAAGLAISIDLLTQSMNEQVAAGQAAAEAAAFQADAINQLNNGIVLEEEARRQLVERLAEQAQGEGRVAENARRLLTELGALQRANIEAAEAAAVQAEEVENLSASYDGAIADAEAFRDSLRFESESLTVDISGYQRQLRDARGENELIVAQLERQLLLAESQESQSAAQAAIDNARLQGRLAEIDIQQRIEAAQLRQRAIAAEIAQTEAEILRLKTRQEILNTDPTDTATLANLGEQERLATQQIELQASIVSNVNEEIAGLEAAFDRQRQVAIINAENEELRRQNAQRDLEAANARREANATTPEPTDRSTSPAQAEQPTAPPPPAQPQFRSTEDAIAGAERIEAALRENNEFIGTAVAQAVRDNLEATPPEQPVEQVQQQQANIAAEVGAEVGAATQPISTELAGLTDAVVTAATASEARAATPTQVDMTALFAQLGVVQTALVTVFNRQVTAQGLTTTNVQNGTTVLQQAISNIRLQAPATLPPPSGI